MSDIMREALEWIDQNYEGYLNHVDFRLQAKIRAENALEENSSEVTDLRAALLQIARLRPAGDISTAKNTRLLVEQMEQIALKAVGPSEPCPALEDAK